MYQISRYKQVQVENVCAQKKLAREVMPS